MRVLVVDDDEAIRQITQMALELFMGWTVVAVEGGEAAVEAASAGGFDAMVLDVMMPGMDGPTVVDLLRGSALTRDLPIVLLTARAAPGRPQPWDGRDIQGVISKPFRVETLGAQISAFVGWTDPA